MTWNIFDHFVNKTACNELFKDQDGTSFATTDLHSAAIIPSPSASHYQVNAVEHGCTCFPMLGLPMPLHNDVTNVAMGPVFCPTYENDFTLPQPFLSDVPMMSPILVVYNEPTFYNPSSIDLQENPTDFCTQYATQCSQLPVMPVCEEESWSFEFPKALCGRLIGKRGQNIELLLQETGTFVSLLDLNGDSALNILAITGKKQGIVIALKMLKAKFGNVQLNKIGESRTVSLMNPANNSIRAFQQKLPENEETEVIITNIIDAGHVYLQMIGATIKSLLEKLQEDMNCCYNKPGIPNVDAPALIGTYCAVKSRDNWFRCQVIKQLNNSKQVELVLVDYGVMIISQYSALKQIRSDFLDVPFQAIECCLMNISPKEGELIFSLDALRLLQNLADGKVLHAISRCTNVNIPYVDLFVKDGSELSVNEQLVKENVVAWSKCQT
eukprot:gene14351-15847_t